MKSYTIENLDCANCATKIEDSIKKLPFVNEVQVQFSTLKLHIDTNDIKQVAKEIKRIEPDVTLLLEDESESGKPTDKFRLPLLVLSVTIYFAALFFEEQIHAPFEGVIYYTLFGLLYLTNGWKVIKKAALNILKGDIFDENFLMTLATIGAVIINALPEAAGVMIFYQFGLYFEKLATDSSRKSISDLLDTKSDIAHVIKAEGTVDLAPEKVSIGSHILVKAGERIPLDGNIIKGNCQLDTSALTGESLPRKGTEGDMVLSGMIVSDSPIQIITTQSYENSTLSKITKMVEEASTKKAPTEKFITSFAKIYTPIVVALALATAIIPSLLLGMGSISEWVYRGLVLLVISCPCALVISIPLAYFGGIGAASKKGFLIKGSTYIDTLAKLKKIAFDKTGTLTKGIFSVLDIYSHNKEVSADEILGIAASIEENSTHPLAKAVTNFARQNRLIPFIQIDKTSEIPGKGLKAESGQTSYLLGNKTLMSDFKIELPNMTLKHGTVIFLANETSNTYMGCIVLGDEIKEDSKEALRELSKLGIKSQLMLTGDNAETAQAVAKELEIDYKAGLLPADKANILEDYKTASTAFVGDGINDAPVLVLADVGISMGAMGSDSAIESSDLVIMNDSLAKIPEAIRMSRRTRRIVMQNIVFALGIKVLIMGFGIAGLSGMWEAIFADVGVTLLAVLNTLRLLRK